MEFDLNKHLIYEDAHLIVLNKPAGLRVIQDGYHPGLPHLKNYTQQHYADVYVVHRLDKDTSGVLLMALDKETHKFLNEQFAKRTINKKYMSVSFNIPEWQYLVYKTNLKVNADRKHRSVVHPEGKPSQTDFYVIHNDMLNNRSTIISAIKTGYTHQIRSHLSTLGFPILGDPLYKNIKDDQRQTVPNPIHRLALHALKISFYHPYQKERLCFKAPIPDDIQSLLVK